MAESVVKWNITYWLCLKDHVIFGFAWSPEDLTEQDVLEHGNGLVTRHVINNWCGICGSTFAPKTIESDFTTQVEAEAQAAWFQHDQNELRRRLDRMNATYDRRQGYQNQHPFSPVFGHAPDEAPEPESRDKTA